MKKYKLIKEYPGSDHEGIIVSLKTPNGLYEGYQYNYYTKHVENNPEYWQEVVDHGFEIISFKQDSNITDFWTKFREGWSRNVNGYPVTGPYSTEAILENSLYKIHSVKRISDGEIFTVGDRAKTITSKGKHTVTQLRIKQKCKGRDGKGGYNYDGIDRIWIDWEDDCGGNWLESTEKVIEKDYEILSQVTKYNPLDDYKASGTKIHSVKRLSDGEVFTVGDLITGHSYTDVRVIEKIKIRYDGSIELEQKHGDTKLAYATKAKNPIFLTHDGKDIFEGDKVWHVNKDALYHSFLIPVSGTKFFSDINAYFLTQEAALDYIEKNKVLFTTEDRVGIKHGDSYYFVDTDFSIHTMKAHSGAGQYSERKYFSTVEQAHEYVMQNVKALSIKDFWEITCMSTSNFNKSTYMKGLVKDRLGIK
jgi:hypothetical protein